MHAAGLLVFTTSGGLVGDGDMHATGLLVLATSSHLVGDGGMHATGLLVLIADGSVGGQGGMQATGLLISIAAGMLSGHGRLLVIPFAEAFRRLDGVAALREPVLTAHYLRVREGKATYRAWR
jgi:hypothetical protein